MTTKLNHQWIGRHWRRRDLPKQPEAAYKEDCKLYRLYKLGEPVVTFVAPIQDYWPVEVWSNPPLEINGSYSTKDARSLWSELLSEGWSTDPQHQHHSKP